MFNKMKIRTKLLVGFIGVAIIATFVGVFGIVEMKKIDNADTKMYETVVQPFTDVVNIATYFQRVRVNVYASLSADTREDANAKLERAKELTVKLDSSIANYAKAYADDQDKKNGDALIASKNTYLNYFNDYAKLVTAGNDSAAKRFMKGDMFKANEATQKAIDVLSAYNAEFGSKLSKSNTKMADNAAIWLIVFVVVAVFLSILLGLVLSGNITKIIKSVLKQTDELVDAAVGGRLDTRGKPEVINEEFRGIIVGFNKTLDAVIGPLNVAAEYVDRISKGNIPPRITDNYNGDFNEIKNNLNQCIDAVDLLVADAKKLSLAAVEGKLDTRADATKHQGDFRVVVEGVNNTLDAVIGPLNVAAEYVERISNGDIPAKITDNYNGDFNEIKNNLNKCIDAVNNLVTDAKMLTVAAVAGKLDTRADASKHQGDFKAVVEGVNNTLDSVIGPLNVAAEYVERISNGDIPAKITDNYNGDFNEIKNNLNKCIDAVNFMVADAKMLAIAAVEGRLATRADATKHYGDFRVIVQGVNETLDSVINPLNVTAKYVEDISKGIIPPIITDNYNGDFNVIKNNLNSVVKMMSELLEQTNIIIKAAADGELDKRANANLFLGGWNQLVSGVNDTITNIVNPLMVTADYVDKVSKGIIPPVITDEYRGQYNVIKTNLNSVVRMMSELLEQTNIIIKAAANGELDKRADASLFLGGWNQLVSGVNDTITNIVNPLMVTADYVDKVSKGIIPPIITDEYRGQYNVIKTNLNSVVKMMSELLEQTNIIIKAAADGELDKRANANLFLGGWNQLVSGVNDTITNIVNPLMVTADYVDKVSKGIIPPTITDEYRGQYNIIKTNLNSVVKMMSELLEQTNIIINAAAVGELDKRANASLFLGGWNQLVSGVNDTITNVVNPLRVTADYVNKIAIGDMPQPISTEYKGEYNVIKNNLNSLILAINNIIENAKKVSVGDLTVELKPRSGNDELMMALTDMVKATADVVARVRNAANNIAAASEEMSSNSQQVSQGATEQASSTEEVSSSMEEMSSNIQQNTDNAQQTEKIANKAAGDILEGSNSVNKTVESMKTIADKVSIISDIAFQTNILALNAAVEAARAGEHGKGFAVVAAEVRKLAERSQIAAAEIDGLSKSSVEVAEKSGTLLANIVPDIQRTSKLVQEITAASIEQNSGADQINNAIQQLNQITQQNAAASEEMATSSEELSSQADQLLELVSFFKIKDSNDNRVQSTRTTTKKTAQVQSFKSNQPKSKPATGKGFNFDLGDSKDDEYERF